MNTIRQALGFLRKTENELRDLVRLAADTGDYDAVMKITRLAQVVSDLSKGLQQAEGLPSVAGTVVPLPARRAIARHGPKSARNGKKSSGRRAGYPRFYCSRDRLVKIGWSKRSKSEYEHKVSIRVLMLLRDVITAVAAKHALFTVEELMPLTDPQDGTQVPSYQIYVCLAWLRNVGIIVQRGRSGYSVPNRDTLVGDVSARLDLIASHAAAARK